MRMSAAVDARAAMAVAIHVLPAVSPCAADGGGGFPAPPLSCDGIAIAVQSTVKK